MSENKPTVIERVVNTLSGALKDCFTDYSSDQGPRNLVTVIGDCADGLHQAAGAIRQGLVHQVESSEAYGYPETFDKSVLTAPKEELADIATALNRIADVFEGPPESPKREYNVGNKREDAQADAHNYAGNLRAQKHTGVHCDDNADANPPHYCVVWTDAKTEKEEHLCFPYKPEVPE